MLRNLEREQVASDYILLFRDSLFAHALSRFLQFAQDILPGDVSGADDAGTDDEVGSVALEPALCCVEH